MRPDLGFLYQQEREKIYSGGALGMPMKNYKPEQIVTLLRQIAVEIANGKNTPQAYPDAEAGPNQTIETASEGKQQAEAAGSEAVVGEADSEGCGGGKLLKP